MDISDVVRLVNESCPRTKVDIMQKLHESNRLVPIEFFQMLRCNDPADVNKQTEICKRSIPSMGFSNNAEFIEFINGVID